MDVPIPYNLREDQLVLDLASIGSDDFEDMMQLIYETVTTEEELERIMRAAVLLKARGFESFTDCLDTAIIWERG